MMRQFYWTARTTKISLENFDLHHSNAILNSCPLTTRSYDVFDLLVLTPDQSCIGLPLLTTLSEPHKKFNRTLSKKIKRINSNGRQFLRSVPLTTLQHFSGYRHGRATENSTPATIFLHQER